MNHQGSLIFVVPNEFQMLNFTLQMLIPKLCECYLGLFIYTYKNKAKTIHFSLYVNSAL